MSKHFLPSSLSIVLVNNITPISLLNPKAFRFLLQDRIHYTNLATFYFVAQKIPEFNLFRFTFSGLFDSLN